MLFAIPHVTPGYASKYRKHCKKPEITMTDVALNADKSNAPDLVAITVRKTGATVRFIQQILPFTVFALALLAWELMVRINNIPHYILPAPKPVLKTLWDNLSSLMVSWL